MNMAVLTQQMKQGISDAAKNISQATQGIRIGELNEKQIHRTLKNFIDQNKDNQEVRLQGNLGIADILRTNSDGHTEVFEIQTKYLYKLCNKLDFYIEKGYDITVVYPVIYKRVLNWVDPQTGEVVEQRSSRTGKGIHEIFSELYGIQNYIGKVRFQVYLIDADEYKYLDGRGINNKKHATKIDKVPKHIELGIDIQNLGDFLNFIPNKFKSSDARFTSSEYSRECKITRKLQQTELSILHRAGLVARVGKKGREYLYKVI